MRGLLWLAVLLALASAVGAGMLAQRALSASAGQQGKIDRQADRIASQRRAIHELVGVVSMQGDSIGSLIEGQKTLRSVASKLAAGSSVYVPVPVSRAAYESYLATK